MTGDDAERAAEAVRQLSANVSRVIIGKEKVLRLLLVALLCEGHVLLEDVPGTGKTTLAKAMARSLDLTFGRIQFTPDLLPSDVTGVSYYNQKVQEFQFRSGPVFVNLLLADEINRATPRTQSALLEAMEERQVTAESDTRPLPRPFFVIATENPVEMEGTFPLPEAQLDRFMMRLSLGYPGREEEIDITRRFREQSPLDHLSPVLRASDLAQTAQMCRRVFVGESVEGYLVDIVRATREYPGVSVGASPRATIALLRASQAMAALDGRNFVLPDDVKILSGPVLGHRLIMSAQQYLDEGEGGDIIEAVMKRVPAPVEGAAVRR